MTISGTAPDTAEAVLDDARLLRRTADRAEQLLLLRVCEWVDLHPATCVADNLWEDDESVPSFAWDALSELGLALGMSDDASRALVREALELRHRLPRVWRRVMAGEILAWRARRIAQRCVGQPDDVAAHLDAVVAPIAHKVGLVTLTRLVDEAMLRLHGEEREIAQLEALDARFVHVFDEISNGGIGTVEIRADWKDVSDFDQMLSLVASALADAGSEESLDVRRAMAVGVLADPANAAQLLTGADVAPVHKQIVLSVHLSEAALESRDLVGRLETGGNRVVLEQQVREWCGRSDTRLTVRPVVDLNDHVGVEQYEIPERLVIRNELLHGRCVFPYCTRPARRCDKDHVIPHGAGGATCDCNLAPLCRRHHRLKTISGWRYTTVEPGVYLWSSPAGLSYLRDMSGTEAVGGRTDPAFTGCLESPAPSRPPP